MKKLTIQKHSSTHNTSNCPNRTIKYIVIHYTAGLKSHAGKGKDVCDMWSKSDRPGSADFVVDEGSIAWQYNPDLKNRKTWHCGGSLQGSGSHDYYKICTNANSIGIEMCSDKKKVTKHLYSSDNDWYITEETWKSAVALAAMLLKRYGLPLSRMIRHADVTSKECPSFMVGKKKNVMYDNKTGEQVWKEFKQDVKEALDELNGKKKDDEIKTVTKVDKDSKRSEKEVVKALQTALNKDFGSKLVVDGAAGKLTMGVIEKHNLKKGSKGQFVKWLQGVLNELGFKDNDGKKLDVDGSLGNKSVESIKKMQKSYGLKVDSIVGTGSVSKLLSKYK